MSAQALPLFGPVEYSEKSGWRIPDSIPEKAGERILLWHPGEGEIIVPRPQDDFPWQQALWSNAVVVVINQPFEIVQRETRDILKEKFGVDTEVEISRADTNSSDEASIWNEPPDGPWPTFGEGFSRFRALSVQFRQPQEHQIKTRPYNQRENDTSHSILDLRIADGSAIFGKSYAIIIMRRTDYSREWATLGRWPIPLPFKIARTHHVITDTEITLVEKVSGRILGAKSLYFIPYPGSKDKTHWTDFIEDIMKATNNFSVSRPPVQ